MRIGGAAPPPSPDGSLNWPAPALVDGWCARSRGRRTRACQARVIWSMHTVAARISASPWPTRSRCDPVVVTDRDTLLSHPVLRPANVPAGTQKRHRLSLVAAASVATTAVATVLSASRLTAVASGIRRRSAAIVATRDQRTLARDHLRGLLRASEVDPPERDRRHEPEGERGDDRRVPAQAGERGADRQDRLPERDQQDELVPLGEVAAGKRPVADRRSAQSRQGESVQRGAVVERYGEDPYDDVCVPVADGFRSWRSARSPWRARAPLRPRGLSAGRT